LSGGFYPKQLTNEGYNKQLVARVLGYICLIGYPYELHRPILSQSQNVPFILQQL